MYAQKISFTAETKHLSNKKIIIKTKNATVVKDYFDIYFI